MPKGNHSNHVKGSNHYRWNKGRIVSRGGYTKIRVGIGHPFADANGYAYEHVLVVVSIDTPGSYLFKKYPRNYVIHHMNGDKLDNRIENLRVIERSEHNALHNAQKNNRKALTYKDAIEIRRRRANGESLKSIASDYGVAFQTISKIARGEKWKNTDGREWNQYPKSYGAETE